MRKSTIIIFVASAALILGLILEADPAKFAAEVAKVDLSIILMVIFLYMLSLVLKAVRWQILLEAVGGRLSLWKSFVYLAIGQAINDLTPVKILGEATRVYATNQQEGVPVGIGLASVGAERIMDLLAVNLALLLSLAFILPAVPSNIQTSLSIVIGAVCLANFVAALVIAKPSLIRRVTAWFGRRLTGGRSEWLRKVNDVVQRGILSYEGSLSLFEHNRGSIALASALTALIWIDEFGRLFLIMVALGATVGVPAVIIASALAITAQVFLPAGSGNVLVVSDVLKSSGTDLATATAAGVLSIVTSIWISVPVAVACMLAANLKFKSGSEGITVVKGERRSTLGHQGGKD